MPLKLEVLAHTGDELRAGIKGVENQKTELAGGLADAKQLIGVDDEQKGIACKNCSELSKNLLDIDKARLDARHGSYVLLRHLVSLDMLNTTL